MAARILVVEDEEAISLTLSELLRQEGYEVDLASTADEALAMLQPDRFDLVLLDLRIGDTSGLSILARLKYLSPETVAVILTGFGSLETAIQAMRDGALDYLLKPCDVGELKAAIARGLRERERARLAASAELARQELERALRARDDFLAMAAHELRTPLAVVLGWAQYLQRTLANGEDSDTTDKLNVLVGQARRLAQLVEDFLDVVRIQNGQLSLNVEPADLRHVVARAVRDAQRAYPERNVRLELADELMPVHVDATRVGQVLGDLLDNAIKFSPAGSAVVTRVATRAGEALVQVRDQGIGIAQAELPRVFERFYQVDGNVMSRHYGGIGLGLFVTRALVEAHGGRLWAESPGLGQGSTFTVVFSLADAPAPEAASAVERSAALRGAAR